MEAAFGLVPPVNNKYFIGDWNDFSSLPFSNQRARRPLAGQLSGDSEPFRYCRSTTGFFQLYPPSSA